MGQNLNGEIREESGIILQEMVEEIEAIGKQAFDMAMSVVKNPACRAGLADQANLLSERLNHLAEELEKHHPTTYQERSDQISESILDLDFVKADMDIVSLRLGHFIEVENIRNQSKEHEYGTSFPLPEDVRNFSKALKSDLTQFQTGLSLEEIGEYYRQAFAKLGFIEYGLLTNITREYVGLVFVKPPQEKAVVIQAVDLGYGTDRDLRHVSLRTEEIELSNGDIPISD
ncbi:MAG: hypothetical protein V1878_03480 [bacterium]